MAFFIDPALERLAAQAQRALAARFEEIDAVAEHGQRAVLAAFAEHRISETHFAGTTGYGYDDRGREAIDAVFATLFGAEDALVRHSFASGTHALACTLFGLLRPGDVLLSLTGKPYDTLDATIGRGGQCGSLAEFGIGYRELPLAPEGLNLEAARAALSDEVKVVLIQRSRGYDSARPGLSAADIGAFCRKLKALRPDLICMVDNCYGEFVETAEPTALGADLCVGSLIKNPGGGLAKSGGYIAGRADLVERVSYSMTAPGIGRECGASLGQNRDLLQGVFMAPHIVAQALKTAAFCAKLYEMLGFEVDPLPLEARFDTIQSIRFLQKEPLIAFCQGIQKGSPVDAFVEPTPWDMPGYDCQVIMAAGGFVAGASSELSADAPIRPPYTAFLQGGLTYESGKFGVLLSAQHLLSLGLIRL